ncbi:MAG: hypothetical protein AB7O24_32345 [Kofleriaceae bacterium]
MDTDAYAEAEEASGHATDLCKLFDRDLDGYAAHCPALVEPITVSPRDAQAERGVPFTREVLGTKPAPFGVLSAVHPGATTAQLATQLTTDTAFDTKVRIPTGIDGVTATLHMSDDVVDRVVFRVPSESKDTLVRAWGKAPSDVWVGPHWRADLDGRRLTLRPYTPFAKLLGRGPDGLAERAAAIGATKAELQQRFGDRVAPNEDDESEAGYRLTAPVTELCDQPPTIVFELADDRVTQISITVCFDGTEAGRRAVVEAMERAWGRARPQIIFGLMKLTFERPRRRIEAQVEQSDSESMWTIEIKPK